MLNHERLKSYIFALDVAKKVPDMINNFPSSKRKSPTRRKDVDMIKAWKRTEGI